MLGSHLPLDLVAGHHRRHLIVKVRESAARLGLEDDAGAATAPGLAALARHAAAGRLHRVAPLHRRAALGADARPADTIASVMAAAADVESGKATTAGVMMVEVREDALLDDLRRDLESDPNVEYASRVPLRYLLAAKQGKAERQSTTPPPASEMWNLIRIKWAEARALPGLRDAHDIKVAVVDTAVDREHPDLVSCVDDYVFAHPDRASGQGRDPMGHGTHVSGAIAAVSKDDHGATGMCRCTLRVWKIFESDATYDRTINLFVYALDPVMYRRALAECLEEKVDVVNLSLGGPDRPDPHEQTLYDEMLAAGSTLVAAMGNARQQGNPTLYPAALPGVIAVGAVDRNDHVGSFSSSGPHISITAPGVDIWSTLPTYAGQLYYEATSTPKGPVRGKAIARETHYGAWFGTSMAAPQVSAAAALLLANRGTMPGSDVRQHLMATADRVPGMDGAPFSPDYGAGRLNLLTLLSK